MAVFPKDIRSQVPEDNIAEFVWFSNPFQFSARNHIKNLVIRLLHFLFSSFRSWKMTTKVRLKVLDTTSWGRFNKQLTSIFYHCWFLNYEVLPQHHLLKGELKEVCFRFDVTFAATVFFLRANAMQNLSRENFKRGIVFNSIFHCGLMFIVIVLLQAWPNEGISQSNTSQSSTFNHKIRFCTQQRYNFGQRIVPVNVLLGVISVSLFHRLVTQKHFPCKHFSRNV